MPTLHVLRHAKSDWDDDVPDHERPLARRGVRAAGRIAEHMTARAMSPALVLCSSARRARETLEQLQPALDGARQLVEDELYLAGADLLLARLWQVPGGVESVLLIGHNPGMQGLVMLLARGPAEPLARVREGLPTAALATLETGATGWDRLRPRDADLVDLVYPREL